MRLPTIWAVRTEPSEVARANLTANVLVLTVRPVPAEPTCVPQAHILLGIGSNMQEGAFLTLPTLSMLTEKLALWHFRHIIDVKVLTLVTFFTETTDPMLAHFPIKTARVTEMTAIPLGTHAFLEELACLSFNAVEDCLALCHLCVDCSIDV